MFGFQSIGCSERLSVSIYSVFVVCFRSGIDFCFRDGLIGGFVVWCKRIFQFDVCLLHGFKTLTKDIAEY